MKNTPVVAKVIFLMAFVAVISAFFTRCSSSKNVNKVDSTVISSVEADLRKQIAEQKVTISNYEKTIHEMQYSGIVFDSSKCPQLPHVTIPQDCNSDSLKVVVAKLNKTIDDLNSAMKGLKNKVSILADGSVKAEGNIASVTVTKEKLQQINAQLVQQVNTLTDEVEKWKSSYNSMVEEKNKISKTKFLPDWWLFPAGMLTGIFLWARFGKTIKSLFIQNKTS